MRNVITGLFLLAITISSLGQATILTVSEQDRLTTPTPREKNHSCSFPRGGNISGNMRERIIIR